jgi:protein SCO1/2
MKPLILGLLFSLALLAGCGGGAPPVETEVAIVLPEPRVLPEFTLSRGEAAVFDRNSLQGRWSLFFFGYTRCPDVCPTELFTLAELLRKIEQTPAAVVAEPQVVFVSVDPQQDLPAAVQRYVGYYHPRFVGATAEQSVVDRLSRSMGAVYERVYYRDGREFVVDPQKGPPQGLESAYLINHSATIFLLNPQGRLHALFSTPHVPEKMIADLNAIQQGWR